MTQSMKEPAGLEPPDLVRAATALQDPETIAPPKLVRGKTGLVAEDKEGIAALVVEVLAWDVDPAEVKVRDFSGGGGSKTYKVSTPGVAPVAMHLRRKAAENVVSEERMAAAAKLLGEYRLFPQRLAEGGDWYIEKWEGLGPVGNPVVLNETAPLCNEIMVLVPPESEDRLVFEHAAKLRAPFPLGRMEGKDAEPEEEGGSEEVALTLLSHPDKAVVLRGAPTLVHDRYDIVKMGLGPSAEALRVRFDGNYLTSDGRLFDIDCWKIRENNHLWWLKEVEGENKENNVSRRSGGGRDFKINEDGTISPAQSGAFVLGVQESAESVATAAETGRLLAKVHQVSVDWFEPFREQFCGLHPGLEEASNGSAVWWYSARGKEFFSDLDAEGLRNWIRAFPEPKSDAGKRVVTAHFDFHPGNIIRTEEALGNQFLRVIDLEFCCVSSVANDIGYACSLWLKGSRMRREFARAYLQAMGDPATEEDVDALLIDAVTAQLGMIHGGLIWESKQTLAEGRRELLDQFLAIADDARSDAELREEVLEHGLLGCARGRAVQRSKLRYSSWYRKMAALEAEPPEARGAPSAAGPAIEIRAAGAAEPEAAGAAPTLALQVRAGSSLCELGEVDGSANQQWRQDGEALQHVGTGLWLDSESKYCYLKRGQPWESCGSELRVRPREPSSDRQRWILDGARIRHVIDGRVLDVNFGDQKPGQGVHVNVENSFTAGQAWEFVGEVPEAPAVETTLPPAPIVPDVDGAEFLIQPAADKSLCLAVRADGYTKDPFEVYLASVGQDTSAQRWRLVRNCTFQHVESGRFLHSETKYARVKNVGEPWMDNHTDLVTRPEDFSDRQRWVVGPEEFHGGKVLRHFKDGRGVDIHGWNLSPDNNVGCENSVHADCRGISYVFTVVPKTPAPRSRLMAWPWACRRRARL